MKQIRGRPMAGRTVLITGGTAGIGRDVRTHSKQENDKQEDPT